MVKIKIENEKCRTKKTPQQKKTVALAIALEVINNLKRSDCELEFSQKKKTK